MQHRVVPANRSSADRPPGGGQRVPGAVGDQAGPSGGRSNDGDGAWRAELLGSVRPDPRLDDGCTLRERVRGRVLGLVETVAVRGGVTPRAVIGLIVLGAAVLIVLGLRLAVVSRHAQPVPLRDSAATSATDRPADRGAGGATPSSDAVAGVPSGTPADVAANGGPAVPGVGAADPTGAVLVHVVGQVRRPGVVRLPAGSRVEQALAAAGGATSHADLVRVNLARPVVDGEQIVVPRPGEPVVGAAGVAGTAGVPGGAAGAMGSGAPVSTVDLNTATVAELDGLPGVGPVLAQRILDWRQENGRFRTVDELGEVSGIGDKVLARLRPRVRV